MHFQEFLHHLLQPQQVDELVIGCRGQEVKIGGGGFGWRNLQQRLLQLLTQGQLGSCLSAGWGVIDAGVWRR